MARKCSTVPGYGACCAAATQGRLGAPFRFTDSKGNQRCGECNVIQRSKGKGPGFQFRFHRNSQCGLGPHGCPALAGPAAPAALPYTTPAIGYTPQQQIGYSGGIVPQFMQ